MTLEAGTGAALFALALFGWGAHAVAPLAVETSMLGRRWPLVAPILLLAASGALLVLIDRFQDAAVAARLAPLTAAPALRALGVLSAATLVADLLALSAWRQLEARGWRLLAGLGVALTLAGAFTLGVLVAGPDELAWRRPVRAVVLALLAVASGEILGRMEERRGRVPIAAGLALPLLALALPREVRDPAIASGGLATLGSSAALLLGSRFVRRPSLRRGAVAGALLLAALFGVLAIGLVSVNANTAAPIPVDDPIGFALP